ncbi:CocE/NonD family hydrolase [Microbacterium sp. RD1]|uniref:CocE/NonD family hydrolase n=1 Tax=Microbacterium sp. RD1 TaxID=3457313 RepID=UPI003FA5D299
MGLRIDTDVAVPMRDGVALAADVWRPDGTGPWPALVARTPYGRSSLEHLGNPKLPDVRAMVDAGYVVVVQDVRGMGGSPGLFEPHRFDEPDTVDTLSWAADQPWCDGALGMWGASYMGFVQWQAAPSAPAGLRAIAPTMTSADIYEAWHAGRGALSQSTLYNWAARMAFANVSRRGGDAEARREDALAILAALDDAGVLFSQPESLRAAFERALPWFAEMQAHPDLDAYWEPYAALQRVSSITVPALNVAGWFDVFASQVARAFATMRRAGGSEDARDGQQLVIGPWGHGDAADTGMFPDRSFGVAGSVKAADITGTHLRFFDRWVRGRTDAQTDARVRIFVMGVDQWREEQDWPLPDTSYEDLFLTSDGRANGSAGDGRLQNQPAPDDSGDVFAYDPTNPVPTVGGATLGTDGPAGPADQTLVETRPDVLCYTSDALGEPLEATGHVTLTLHVSSSASDTDVTGKLVDVFPDGRALLLCEGVCRMRYRRSLAEPVPLVPGDVVEVTVDLGITSNVFRPGHRIRLEVSSSNHPRYDRNLNGGDAATPHVAVNRIAHGRGHPSRLTLPVIRREP